MIPSQKCGMDRPKSAPSMLHISTSEPRRTAETMPTGTATTSAKSMAATASSRLAGSLSRISSMAGTL